MNGSQNLQWLFRVRNGIAHQRGFIRTRQIMQVARSGIPGGGNHALVILNVTILDDNPMGQRPPGSLVKSEALLFPGREGRWIHNGKITPINILHQQLPVFQGIIGQHRRPNRPGQVAAQGRMKHLWTHPNAGQRAGPLQGAVNITSDFLVPLA